MDDFLDNDQLDRSRASVIRSIRSLVKDQARLDRALRLKLGRRVGRALTGLAYVVRLYGRIGPPGMPLMTDDRRALARSRRIDRIILGITRRLCGRLDQALHGGVGLAGDPALRALDARLVDVLMDWGLAKNFGEPFDTNPVGPLFIGPETFLDMEALLGAIPTLSSAWHHLVGYGPEMPKVVTLTERILVRAPAPLKPEGPPWDVRLDASRMDASINGETIHIDDPDGWKMLVPIVEASRLLEWITEAEIKRRLGWKKNDRRRVMDLLKDRFPLLKKVIQSKPNGGHFIDMIAPERNSA